MKLKELKEYIDSYAFNRARKELAKYLDYALDDVLACTEIDRVILFGSYFTPKLRPNDLDIIIDPKDSLSYELADKLERPIGGIHLRVMGGKVFDAFGDWAKGETVVIE